MATQIALPSQSPRILIVRLSAVGDLVQTVPVLCALRESFPKAFLGWATEEPVAPLLEGHRALDALITVPRRWMRKPGHWLAIQRRLRALRFDVAIDVQSLTKSALLARLSGARWRIGFAPPAGRELSVWLNTDLVHPTAVHMVDRYLQLLWPLGVRRPAVSFHLPETASEAQAARQTLLEAAIDGDFALINPGAGWPSKLWPTERYAAVARHLWKHWAIRSLVVWAGQRERAMAEHVVAAAEHAACLAPPTTLRQLASLARLARVFLGADTGPLHIAAAVCTPCVGLYWPWPAERHGPYGSGHIAVEKMRFDGPTRQRRRLPPAYMEAIDVASVCQACDAILSRSAENHAA